MPSAYQIVREDREGRRPLPMQGLPQDLFPGASYPAAQEDGQDGRHHARAGEQDGHEPAMRNSAGHLSAHPFQDRFPLQPMPGLRRRAGSAASPVLRRQGALLLDRRPDNPCELADQEPARNSPAPSHGDCSQIIAVRGGGNHRLRPDVDPDELEKAMDAAGDTPTPVDAPVRAPLAASEYRASVVKRLPHIFTREHGCMRGKPNCPAGTSRVCRRHLPLRPYDARQEAGRTLVSRCEISASMRNQDSRCNRGFGR